MEISELRFLYPTQTCSTTNFNWNDKSAKCNRDHSVYNDLKLKGKARARVSLLIFLEI